MTGIAERYVTGRFPAQQRADDVGVRVDEKYCVEVARRFGEAAGCVVDRNVQRRYDAFKQETLDQFQALVDGGVAVRPWLAGGQPYRSSTELRSQVRATSMLYVFLTRCGHGPCAEVNWNHPMCEVSPIKINGEELLYNDLFRAVHDAFGHVMHGNGFSVAGEFRATHDHLRMYSEEARAAVFAETIGQICWFYYGPHLLGANGKVLRKDDPGYVPVGKRPYPQQKVLIFPDELMDRYDNLFERIGA